MRFHDITVPLSANTPTYPGDPPIEVHDWKSISKGDTANVSLLHFGAHSATHVDAPAHFIEGAPPVKSLPLESLIGNAQVVEVPEEIIVIDGDFVARKVERTNAERVLFKTRNSRFWKQESKQFHADFTHLDASAARKLVEFGAKLVGIDYLSIEQFHSPDHAVHLCLLSKGIVILEGLDLSDVNEGRYELICLPLKIATGHGDGAPARAVLREL